MSIVITKEVLFALLRDGDGFVIDVNLEDRCFKEKFLVYAHKYRPSALGCNSSDLQGLQLDSEVLDIHNYGLNHKCSLMRTGQVLT